MNRNMTRRRATTWSVLALLLCVFVRVSSSWAGEDVWSEYEARCTDVLKRISAGKFAELEEDFNAEMKKAVPAARLAQICVPLTALIGDLDTVAAHRQMAASDGNLKSFELWVRPTKTERLVKVSIMFDQDDKIAGLLLTPTLETSPPAEKAAALAKYETKTRLALPFRGEWTVASGGPTPEQNGHGDNRNQLFAYDFWLADESGERFRNGGRKNEDYLTFGQPVLAPGDGTVRQVVDGVEDNIPGERNPYFVPGNLVVIDHGNGEYSFLAHFKQGTIEVQVGQRVERGDQLGLCGNSGNSSEPHIHYHLANAPLMQDGDGLPARFGEIAVDGEVTAKAFPVRGDRVWNVQPLGE